MRREGNLWWTLRQRHGGHYQVIHYAAWKAPDGTLLDVTPSESVALREALFMADHRVPFDYEKCLFPASFLCGIDSTIGNVYTAWIGPDDVIYPEFGLMRPMFI